MGKRELASDISLTVASIGTILICTYEAWVQMQCNIEVLGFGDEGERHRECRNATDMMIFITRGVMYPPPSPYCNLIFMCREVQHLLCQSVEFRVG